MNTRWIILFSFFYLLLLINQAEVQGYGQRYGKTSPVGKRRFPLERIVQVFGCYLRSERLNIVKAFVKVKFLFLFMQHQDPAQKTATPTRGYLSGPIGREVRQKEVSWCFNYDDI